MARYSATVRTSAGSTTLPIISLYATATVNFRMREIGVFNTTTTAVALQVSRLSTRGTAGAAITVFGLDASSVAASCTPFTTHTVGPTITTGAAVAATLGAAAGAGMVWTFANDTGLNVNAGTANGIGIVPATGSGQICDAYMIWDE